jgi:anion-transporting  ArsA/GET3 family ATPase
MSRLLVVAGKGGVGKTTVTAALARASADRGMRVLVVSLDGRPGLATLLGGHPDAGATYDGDVVAAGLGPDQRGSIHLRTISASEALQDYLATQGLARLAKRLVSTGVVDVVASAAPGIDDLLVLGKIKHLVSLTGPDGPHDLIIADGPAAGHALSLFRSPAAMAETVRGGPIRSQAIEVDQMLRDPSRCRVVLVTLPESTPVSETLETAAVLTAEIGTMLAPMVVNGFDSSPEIDQLVSNGRLPEGNLAEAARFRSRRCAVHRRELDRLTATTDAAVLTLPHLAKAGLDSADVRTLAEALAGSVVDREAED